MALVSMITPIVMVNEKRNNENIVLYLKHKHCSLLAIASSNTNITRVPAGTIVDELVANSGQSSFDLTSSS
jgi:hypothetical protein